MDIHRALQEPQDTTTNILAIVAAVDALDCTLYYPDEIWEVALMDDRYIFISNISVLCAVAWAFFIYCCLIHKLVNQC
jgi:hypothetical protein